MWVRYGSTRSDPYLTQTGKISGSAGFLAWRSLIYFQIFLEVLGDEAAHPVRGLFPHVPGDVGVGVQGEACTVVAQDVGYRLDVHSLLDSQSCERMPLWHNKDKSENPCVATGWLVCPYSFSTKNGPEMGSAGGDEKLGLHLKDKFF